MIEEVTGRFQNVKVVAFEGLLVEFARRQGAVAVVRGLRAVSDFEFEFQMALMNRKLEPAIETVFLTPREEYTYLSSRIVKEIARLGGAVDAFVPGPVVEALRKKLRNRRVIGRVAIFEFRISIRFELFIAFMKVHIKQIPAEGLHLEGEEPAAILELNDPYVKPRSGVRWALDIGLSDGGLFATGKLAVDLDVECVSCLRKFTYPLRVDGFCDANRIEWT